MKRQVINALIAFTIFTTFSIGIADAESVLVNNNSSAQIYVTVSPTFNSVLCEIFNRYQSRWVNPSSSDNFDFGLCYVGEVHVHTNPASSHPTYTLTTKSGTINYWTKTGCASGSSCDYTFGNAGQLPTITSNDLYYQMNLNCTD